MQSTMNDHHKFHRVAAGELSCDVGGALAHCFLCWKMVDRKLEVPSIGNENCTLLEASP